MFSSCSHVGQGSPAPLAAAIIPAADRPLLVPKWYAVSVFPRHEKQVAQLLGARHVSYLLPLYSSLRRWKDRRKEVEMVLFPGYVFVNVTLQDRLSVLMVPSVVRFVSFQGRPAVVPDQDIRAISIGHSSGANLQPHPFLRKGQRVRVIAGPLVHTEGILIRRNSRSRLVLSLASLMRSISLEVDECDVIPC